MQPVIEPILNDIADVINYLGVAIIVIAVAKTLIAYAQVSLFSLKLVTPSSLRLNLGRSLTLGLDFQIASDIIRIAVVPTAAEVAFLAATIALRAILSYLIEREIRFEQTNQAALESSKDATV